MKVLKPFSREPTQLETDTNPRQHQDPPKAEAAMHTDAPTRKNPGRLSREDQRRLGDILQRVYDDVVRQGVPDRFKDLLDELEDQTDSGKTGQQGLASPNERDPEADSSIEARGSANPQIKGSH